MSAGSPRKENKNYDNIKELFEHEEENKEVFIMFILIILCGF